MTVKERSKLQELSCLVPSDTVANMFRPRVCLLVFLLCSASITATKLEREAMGENVNVFLQVIFEHQLVLWVAEPLRLCRRTHVCMHILTDAFISVC